LLVAGFSNYPTTYVWTHPDPAVIAELGLPTGTPATDEETRARVMKVWNDPEWRKRLGQFQETGTDGLLTVQAFWQG
jgi:hypothetical protein